MRREREVKLRILERDGFERLLRVLPERGVRAQLNVYFDTPGWDLCRLGRSVRVRVEDERIVLTVKRDASASAGRIESDEAEAAIPASLWSEIASGRARIESAGVLLPALLTALEGRSVAEVGRLSNMRHLREGPSGALYELDETRLPSGETHYELEIETEDTERELSIARDLLQRLGVAHDDAVSTKQERLYRALGRSD